MRAYIRKLQSKPEEVRKQILVTSLVVSMVFVGIVWVYGLTNRFGEKTEEVKVVKDNNEISPFKVFTNSITSTYNNITASVGNFPSNEEAEVNTSTSEEKQVDLIIVEKTRNQ